MALTTRVPQEFAESLQAELQEYEALSTGMKERVHKLLNSSEVCSEIQSQTLHMLLLMP